jgi:glucokinase
VTTATTTERGDAIGIDLGGTNLRAARFAGLDRAGDHPELTRAAIRPVAEHRERVGEVRTPEAIVARIGALVEELGRAGGAADAPVGIGFAGMLRGLDGVVSNSPHMGWREVPFGALLRARLPGRRVVVENDVNAITWGELRLGAARGARDVVAVFVGTGIGAGVVADGVLLRGSTGCAAELGHVKVVWGEGAAPCACGKAGCVEAYLGGEYVQRRARAEHAGGVRSAALALAGSIDALNPGHIDQAAAAGDRWALALWRELAPYLGVTLANAVTTLNPMVLVLGGGVLSRTPTLRGLVMEAFARAVNQPAAQELVVVDAALGDDAGVIGSALLALEPEPR